MSVIFHLYADTKSQNWNTSLRKELSTKKKTQNQKNILPLSPFKYVKTSKVLKITEGLQKVKKLPREKKHFIEKSACW